MMSYRAIDLSRFSESRNTGWAKTDAGMATLETPKLDKQRAAPQKLMHSEVLLGFSSGILEL